MCLTTSSLQVSSARATVDLEQHQSSTPTVPELCFSDVYTAKINSLSVRGCYVCYTGYYTTWPYRKQDDRRVQMYCYHNNNRSTAEPGKTSHSLLLTNQVAGMAPCDSAASICRSEIIWLQLKPSEPQRARSSPWLWIHYPSKISLLFTHGALFVSVTTQRRGATYSCQTCLQFQLLVAPLSTVF